MIARPSLSLTVSRSVGSWEMSRIAWTGDCRLIVPVEEAVLDHVEHQGRGPDLQIGGDLRHVRVAHDDVQAAVTSRRRRAARRAC